MASWGVWDDAVAVGTAGTDSLELILRAWPLSKSSLFLHPGSGVRDLCANHQMTEHWDSSLKPTLKEYTLEHNPGKFNGENDIPPCKCISEGC